MGGVISTIDGTTGMLALMANGVIMNILQLAAYGIITPFSRDAFRKLNWYICYLSWAPLIAWGERTTRLVMHGNAQDWGQLSRDRALVLSNHIAGMDWLMMWAVTERTGGLPACKALLKESLRFLPFLGWSWACADYPFLARQWDKDKKSLAKSFQGLREYTSPYLLTVFAEGTRRTATKLRESQEFAKSKGWKSLQNVMLPKTKGFTATVNALADQLDSVFDVTLVSPPGLEPTLGSVITGKDAELHVLLDRMPIDKIPLGDDTKSDAWLRQRWAVKDDRISGFLSSGSCTFPGGIKRVTSFNRSILPRVLYRTIQGIFVIALVYLVYKAFRTDDEDVLRFRMRVVDIEGLLAHFNSHADMDIGGLEETLRALGRGMKKKSQVDAVCGDDRFRRLLATIGAKTAVGGLRAAHGPEWFMISRGFRDLDHRSLAAVAAALSAMPTSSTPEIIELCQRITVAAIKTREKFKPTALASLALGLASRGSKDPSFLEMVKEDTLAQIDEFSPSELCSILEAQRRWGVHDRDLTEAAIERLTDEIDRFTVNDLVRTLEVVASLGLARGMLLRRLSALAHDQIPQFTPPQLVDILKSLCQLRFLSTVQVEGILEGLGDIREALSTPRRVSEVFMALVSTEYYLSQELRDNLMDYYSQLRDERQDEGVQLGSLVDMAWSMCASSIHSDLLYDIVKEIYEAPPPRNRDILAKMIEVDKAVAVEGRGAEAPEAWRAAFGEAQRMEIERTEKSRLHFELLDALDALRGARGLDIRLDIMRNRKIGGYVVDFFDEKANLVIEIDTLNKPTPL
ncbi:1-acyl-sn-glycerol-3-phosphate acyltransferase delta [Perkinsus olseni]|uniref:1-acyl-sn-glycerol-3-phosphate acyltransferase delta n=4 Tax=Perkinsus olseni TaxID=32597 RepID=A0A7J6NE07_PEROL|nr:1-acyl-sn-glycerol-3-phosphate acyltransferase delta [Perkinsus olseni]